MAYCKNCGAPLEAGSRFCTNCGFNADSEVPGVRSTDHTAEYDANDIKSNKILSLYCYLGILMVIPLVAKPGSDFIKFHANQGLVLLTFDICLAILCIIPILGWIAAAVGYIFSFVCIIIGIVNSCSGRATELPFIGRFNIINR